MLCSGNFKLLKEEREGCPESCLPKRGEVD